MSAKSEIIDITKFPRGVPDRDLRGNIAPHAMWADPKKIAVHPRWKYEEEPGKVFLGSVGNQLIGVRDDRHLMTIAGSRAGKGVSTIIPNLIEYPGSILVIDPKGENARITRNRRAKGLGQDVFVLDPFGVSTPTSSSHPTSSFNPLNMIDPMADTAVDDAALIAEGLIIPSQGDAKHWSDSARNFLRGLILYVAAMVEPLVEKRNLLPPEKRNLLYVRKLLTLDPKGFEFLIADMMKVNSCNGVIKRAANSIAGKEEKERSGVISTAIEQTDFLDSPAMARCLGQSQFSLADLKRRPTTVYLCLPARFMGTHNRWLRIIINLAVAAMEVEPTKPQHPVLFIMDEFAVLDHLSSIEKAAGQIAGFDVRLWPILQDLTQLKSIYKDRWETFMGNASVIQCFGNNDLTTLEYLSKRLGKSTIVQVNRSEVVMKQSAEGLTGQSMQMHDTDLMTADEIGRFFSRQSNTQLLLWPGADPIAIERVKYHEHPFFKGKFDL